MFSERFDALMNIAEVTNSTLGRGVKMNPSHIGRLRSGARPLAKKHDYLPFVCTFLAEHIQKDYQINALQKLTGITGTTLTSVKSTSQYLEKWLLEQVQDSSAAAVKLISGFSRLASHTPSVSLSNEEPDLPVNTSSYLFGNEGKRKAVEQFFLSVLSEETPQTLLLFSDENMEWLYEDEAFAARWTDLFVKVIARGNHVRIIHSLSRDMNEMLEAVTKWIPLYMTGAIEPYCYPKLRDGLFHRTMFIAPNTSAIISSCVQQNTDGMLNLFITDKAAIEALCTEYDNFFKLCRPLMHIFTHKDSSEMMKTFERLAEKEGDSFLCCIIPPLFTLPKELAFEISEQIQSPVFMNLWEKGTATFEEYIQNNHIHITLLDPELALLTPDKLCLPMLEMLNVPSFSYTKRQYMSNIVWLRQLEEKYHNLTIDFSEKIVSNTLLFVKEDAGVFMAKTDSPITAFSFQDTNMVNAFWDCMVKRMLF